MCARVVELFNGKSVNVVSAKKKSVSVFALGLLMVLFVYFQSCYGKAETNLDFYLILTRFFDTPMQTLKQQKLMMTKE